MEITTQVVRDGSKEIQAFAYIFGKTFKESFLRAAKSAVKMAIAIMISMRVKARRRGSRVEGRGLDGVRPSSDAGLWKRSAVSKICEPSVWSRCCAG